MVAECAAAWRRGVEVNAFTHTTPLDRTAPAASAGVLRGAPVAVKANLCVEGVATTAGSRMLQQYVAPYTATAVSRLLQAGGRLVGMTNMDEFGMGSSTSWSVHGATRNPTTTAAGAGQALTPGGSSGGSAAAVACGAVVAALGSDTGGSIRQPAAFCSVVGFKPSYGRIPRWGLVSYASSLDTVGIIGRSVDDVALVYDVTAGWDGRDDTAMRGGRWLPPSSRRVAGGGATSGGEHEHAPAHPTAHAVLDAVAAEGVPMVQQDLRYAHWRHPPTTPGHGNDVMAWARHCHALESLRNVRIGIPAECYVNELPAPIAVAWGAAAEALRRAGAAIVSVHLPHMKHAVAAYYVVACAEAASNLSRYDGVRLGHRAAADASAATAEPDDGNAAAALHELYCRTRSEGFGPQVQRRVMLGNLALSHGAKAAYYDAAKQVQAAVRHDFDAAFRPVGAMHMHAGTVDGSQPRAGALAEWMAGQSAMGRASASTGVDVILMPTAPTMPWPLAGVEGGDPGAMFMNDVMTIPPSLARLPAISVPVRQPATPALPVPTIGMQLVGRYADEDTVLRVAAALEMGVASD